MTGSASARFVIEEVFAGCAPLVCGWVFIKMSIGPGTLRAPWGLHPNLQLKRPPIRERGRGLPRRWGFTPSHLVCSHCKTHRMKDHVYKLIELTGTSTTSIEDAVGVALKRAHKTIKNLGWFQVVETRGSIDKGKVQHWQVTIKVGFTIED